MGFREQPKFATRACNVCIDLPVLHVLVIIEAFSLLQVKGNNVVLEIRSLSLDLLESLVYLIPYGM